MIQKNQMFLKNQTFLKIHLIQMSQMFLKIH